MALTLTGEGGEPIATDFNPDFTKAKLGVNQTNFDSRVAFYTKIGQGLPSISGFGVENECSCDESSLGALASFFTGNT